MGSPQDDAVVADSTRRCTTTGSAPSRGCGRWPAWPALALFVASRRGVVPRWIGLVGLVLGGLTVLLGVSPLEYMAGVTGALWLLVTALGFTVRRQGLPRPTARDADSGTATVGRGPPTDLGRPGRVRTMSR